MSGTFKVKSRAYSEPRVIWSALVGTSLTLWWPVVAMKLMCLCGTQLTFRRNQLTSLSNRAQYLILLGKMILNSLQLVSQRYISGALNLQNNLSKYGRGTSISLKASSGITEAISLQAVPRMIPKCSYGRRSPSSL